MRRKVVVISENSVHAPHHLKRLSEAGFEVVDLSASAWSLDEQQLIAALDRAWAVVAGGGEVYSRRVLEACPGLRVIARSGVGYDAVDVDAATELGVAVVITPGANAEAVADFALGLMLASLKRITVADADVRSGRWRSGGPAGDLFGATVGIVGLGRIGQAVARRLRGFSCRLLAAEPYPDREACATLGVELMTLDEMLPQVDVLTLHVPLGAGTRHLIGTRELRLMRPHATLVNTSRGSVVDGSALADALRGGVIGGAGLDVFELEPLPATDELMRLPSVVLTGHLAGFSEGAVSAVVGGVVDSLIDLANGGVPAGCVNPAIFTSATRL
jgi:D-3-phosphoglycerate dehydrogenase / 2-oxoglutarate reductase